MKTDEAKEKILDILAKSGKLSGQELAEVAIVFGQKHDSRKAYENGYEFHKEVVAIEIKKFMKKLGIKV